jgi:hypothetical protein
MNPNAKYVHEYTVKFFKNLAVIGCTQLVSIDNLNSTTLLTLKLHELRVDVADFGDCFALLDGRLKQLTTFIVDINCPENNVATNYNIVGFIG